MLLPDLRREVLEANLELVRKGLVLFTFGNASGISRKKGLVVIKPSGVPYERMKPADIRPQRRYPGIRRAHGLLYFGYQFPGERHRTLSARQTFSEKTRQRCLLRAA